MVGQEQPLAKMLQKSLVLELVVKREHGLDIFPLAPFGGDASSAHCLGPVHQMVYRENILSLIVTFDYGIFGTSGVLGDDAIKPVFYSGCQCRSATS